MKAGFYALSGVLPTVHRYWRRQFSIRNFRHEAVMAGYDTRGRRDRLSNAPNYRFLVGVVVVAIAVIALSLSLGVQAPPDGLM